jgi:hypothetical protein
MPISNFELSVTSGATLVNIETTTELPPFAVPVHYPVTLELANGSIREQGGRVCSWRWAGLTKAQFTALRAILTTKTKTVWIRTIGEDKFTYAYFTGLCIWPAESEIQRPMSPQYSTGEFILRFRNLVTFTP